MSSPAAIEEVIAHLDELLDPGAFTDLGPNGLQVPGRALGERLQRRFGVEHVWIDVPNPA